MRLAPLIARLTTEVPALQARVRGVADLAAARDRAVPTPAAYVLPLAESAAANASVPALSQRVAVRLGVVLAVRNVADPSGAASQSRAP